MRIVYHALYFAMSTFQVQSTLSSSQDHNPAAYSKITSHVTSCFACQSGPSHAGIKFAFAVYLDYFVLGESSVDYGTGLGARVCES